MAYLDFHPNDYSVAYKSDTIALLAKEYSLLQFLYRHAGRPFTREQLLDQVWGEEYPGERTVDDHIYRLRKKLTRWSGQIRLVTVRGLGYSLIVQETPAIAVPSRSDGGLQQQIAQLLETYQKLGQSQSMLALANQQELLGVNIDAFYLIFLRFVQADLDWFLHSPDAEDRDKLYWLLVSYYAFYREPQKCLDYFERAIKAGILPFHMHRELEMLNIIGLYTDNGHLEEDLLKIEAAYRVIDGLAGELDGFKVHVATSELYVHLKARHISEAERCSERIEGMLAETPYLREICSYQGLKGRLLLLQGRRTEALSAFEHGLEAGEAAHNVPVLVSSVLGTLDFLQTVHHDPPLQRQFQARYDEFDRRYGFLPHKQPLERMIERILDSV